MSNESLYPETHLRYRNTLTDSVLEPKKHGKHVSTFYVIEDGKRKQRRLFGCRMCNLVVCVSNDFVKQIKQYG